MSSVRTYHIKTLAQQLTAVSTVPDRDIRYFLSEITSTPLAELFEKVELNTVQLHQLQAMCARRLSHEPVAYILGYTEFWGLRLQVNPSVLIPRPDTECMVESVLLSHSDSSIRCLDLGTGSGAIALALATERPNWRIDAVDCSKGAITCASENASRLKISAKSLLFHCCDWRAFCSGKHKSQYEIIVANPPYIDPCSDDVCVDTRLYEPDSALYAGANGESDLIDVIDIGAFMLSDGGWLYLEHGYNQGERVRQLMMSIGYGAIKTFQDYSGHDRFTVGQWSHVP